MKKLALNLLLMTFVGHAFSQNLDSISRSMELDEVVVTGQFQAQSLDKSVFRIRTIPMEKIMARGAVRLQDVLQAELNIRFQQDLATGTTSLTLQGLSGQNVKVLIDGVPMVGRQSTDNSFDINQINVNTIERIEIIEGPMAVVYGADALAGVINIITKKGADGRLDLMGRLHEETVGKEYGLDKGIHNQSVGAAWTKGKINLRADVARNFNGGFKGDSTGREMTWHPKKQYLGDVLVGYTGEKSKVYYRADYMNENIYNPGNYGQGGVAAGIALDQNYYSNRIMQQVQGSHNFSDRLVFNGALAYTNYYRKVQTTTVKESTGAVNLAVGGQDKTQFNGTTFRGTLLYRVNNKLSLQPGVDLNYEDGYGGRIAPGTHGIGDYAIFLSGEWQAGSRLSLRPGVRVTHNTVYQAPPALPSINAKIKLTERQDLRLSYGRGFRAPSLRELYFNFFDASHSIEGNPNLKAETSNSFSASWNLSVYERDGNKVTTVIGGFFNDVHDNIAYAAKPNSTITTLINIERYKTKGVTWNNTWKNQNWDLNAGYGYTGRYNQFTEQQDGGAPYQWSSEITANGSYMTNKGNWTFTAYYKYTGSLPLPERVVVDGNSITRIAKTNSYQWGEASVQKMFKKGFTVTGGVRNLLNVITVNSTANTSGVHSAGPSRAIGSGRSYYISLVYTINK